MDGTFQILKTFFGGSLGLLLMGLLFRAFRSDDLPNPDDPGLSAAQRSGVWQVQESVRASPWLIRFGLIGTVVCGIGMVVTTMLH